MSKQEGGREERKKEEEDTGLSFGKENEKFLSIVAFRNTQVGGRKRREKKKGHGSIFWKGK